VAAVLEDAFALMVAGMGEPSDLFLLLNAVASSPAFAAPANLYPLAGTLLDQMRQLRHLLVLESCCLTSE